MSIQALLQSTTRLLSSGQALTSPSTLVKELIDNAIDAKATAIEVILSANTLDKVEVRDNGTGIVSSDFDSLGRRGHTSKLRNFEELKSVGRSSLGFRGEALASAVTLGEVTITTRVEGDAVAVRVKLKPEGGVETSSPTSHPIGTTVCVSNFSSNLPVRHQTFAKDAPKTIARIQEMLKSYALARINVRFSLKILKVTKSNWSYAPRPKDGLKEAVMQVVGKDVAANCIEETADLEDEDGSYTVIEAIIANPNSQLYKTKGGCYISIDNRPMSASRGFLKKIASSYKSSVKEYAQKTGLDAPKNPFMCIAIGCSVDCYDPNVEPAKDDVLFSNEDALVTAAESLFADVYFVPPEMQKYHPDSTAFDTSSVQMFSSSSRFNEDLRELSSDQPPSLRNEPSSSVGLLRGPQVIEKDIDACLIVSQPPIVGIPSLEQGTPSLEQDKQPTKESSNPWTLSRPLAGSSSAGLPYPICETILRQQKHNFQHAFNTPPASKGRSVAQVLSSSSNHQSRFPDRPSPAQTVIDAWLRSDDDRPFGGSKAAAQPRENLDCYQELYEVDTPPRRRQANSSRFVIATSLPLNADMSPPPTQYMSKKFSLLEGFTPLDHGRPSPELPMMSMNDEPASHAHPYHSSLGHSKESGKRYGGGGSGSGNASWNKPYSQPWKGKQKEQGEKHSLRHPSPSYLDLPAMSMDEDLPSHSHPGLSAPANGDVHSAMGFEHWRLAATMQLREQLDEPTFQINGPKPTTTAPSEAMPHAAAFGTETPQLQAASTSQARTEKRGLPDGDPRAYLIKRQKSLAIAAQQGITKLKRTKTALLPLEAISRGQEMHEVAICLVLNEATLKIKVTELAIVDDYVRMGRYAEALGLEEEGLDEVERVLNELMKGRESCMSSAEVFTRSSV